MRNGQIRLPHFLLGKAHDVEIERSRSPLLVAGAARVALDPLEGGQQDAGLERRLHGSHLIEIGPLHGTAKRRSLFDAAHREESRPGKRRERCTCMREMGTAVAEVRAQRDIGDVAHMRITRAPAIVARRATTSEKLALTRREATGILGACQTRAAMDSLTMHYVARELGERWRDRRIVACHADHASRTLTLWCEASKPVSFDLRALAIREARGEPRGEMLRGWTMLGVDAPTDERRLVMRCERPGKFRGSPSKRGDIEVSFVPNARGARVRDARHALATLGAALPRVAEPRAVLDDLTVRAAVDARDEAAMLRGRWMSPDVCVALFSRPESAVELYHLIVLLPPAAPVRCGDVMFPLPLCDDGGPVSSLILPVTDESVAVTTTPDRASRALARMRRELERAREAPRLRAIADALMALGADANVPETIVLSSGTESRVPSSDDARETPVALAERLYKEAGAMERALERLPPRIAALEAGPTTRSGDRRPRPTRRASSTGGERLPYKSYRSSGGIDILVGRGARSNDELTYEIAKPDDVWLHARDVTGAHVVLRWSQEGAPPARDLHEAAALAAWYSRARGSTVVPVDWTRRRHVRRARGGPPGRALVERAKTVMARPSAELERRLRLER
jgi:hypothetical protein